jgi:hypothetical protein
LCNWARRATGSRRPTLKHQRIGKNWPKRKEPGSAYRLFSRNPPRTGLQARPNRPNHHWACSKSANL